MRCVEAVAVPRHADSDVGEVGIDDVGVVAGGSNKCVHDRVDVWSGADVFAELGPVVGYTFANGRGMANEGVAGAYSVGLCRSPFSCERA